MQDWELALPQSEQVLAHHRRAHPMWLHPLQQGALWGGDHSGGIPGKKTRFPWGPSLYLTPFQEDTYIISVNEQREIQGFITDPVDFRKSVTGAPKFRFQVLPDTFPRYPWCNFRVDFIQNSNTLENVTVVLKGPTGVQDVYFVGTTPSNAQVIVSPYIELPQGV